MTTMSKAVVLAGCLLLAGCAGAQVVEPVKIPLPARPIISSQYQGMLTKAGQEITKEAMKHEVEWLNYADKMEMRVE